MQRLFTFPISARAVHEGTKELLLAIRHAIAQCREYENRTGEIIAEFLQARSISFRNLIVRFALRKNHVAVPLSVLEKLKQHSQVTLPVHGALPQIAA